MRCMTPKRILLFVAIIIFLVASITIIYYLANFLAKVNLLWYAGEVSWLGAITGFAGCLFLSSIITTISLRATRSMLTREHGLMFSMLIILSGLATAILWFFKPGDSDVWWYGAIAGFLGCLLLVFLVLISLLLFRLTSKGSTW